MVHTSATGIPLRLIPDPGIGGPHLPAADDPWHGWIRDGVMTPA